VCSYSAAAKAYLFSEQQQKMVYLTEADLRAHIANCEYLSQEETVHYDECSFSELFFSYSTHIFYSRPTFDFCAGREKRWVYTYRCAMRALGKK
jgi:hypothetical protein